MFFKNFGGCKIARSPDPYLLPWDVAETFMSCTNAHLLEISYLLI